jgi:protease-4
MRRVLFLAWIVCLTCLLVSSTRAAEVEKAEKPKAEESRKAEEPKKADGKSAEKPATKKLTVVRFTLRGEYPEGPTSFGLFGDLQTSLQSAVERMDSAAVDKGVAAVWLRIEDLDIGRGKLSELRAAVARIRKAGKPVWAEVTSADAVQYLLASACDEIIMPPSGSLTNVRLSCLTPKSLAMTGDNSPRLQMACSFIRPGQASLTRLPPCST